MRTANVAQVTKAVSLTTALTDPTLPVGEMIPVQAATIPAIIRRDATRMVHRQAAAHVPSHRGRTSWMEVYGPLDTQGGCRFGCKLYARKRGAVTVYGVHHALAYGHSHSPDAR